jgi:methionyl aminopeptidase
VSNVSIKTFKEVEALRVACQMAADTLLGVGDMIRPGITTEDINRFVHEDTIRRGGYPAPLNYHGFPKSVCTSINEVVCHGIPGPQRLESGDIINVDVTTIYNGFFGDTSATFYIGSPSPQARHVTEVARKSLEVGIAQVREGARLGDIGAAIQEYAEGQGCSVVRAFVGHGIGRRFHEAPQVSHVGKRGQGLRLRAGMCFTIEPMINLGGYEVEVLEDKWTVLTADRSLSAQFEHTIVVTKTGCEVLTRRTRPLLNCEVFPDAGVILAAASR